MYVGVILSQVYNNGYPVRIPHVCGGDPFQSGSAL